jgi:hypothetical protein
VTFDEYIAIDAVNNSTLKNMAESPLHCFDAMKRARKATGAQDIGTAEHCMVLEPDQFPPRYVVWTGGRRAGKEWDNFEAANLDKTIIKQEEYEHCVAMRNAVMAHPAAGPIFSSGGEAEKVILWKDPETGLDCKARIDWLCGSIVDLKTTKSANPRVFAASAARYRYHTQLAWYRWGVECATGLADWPCQIVAVESSPPHDVVVYTIDELTLAAGLEGCQGWLRRFAECKASGKWPGRFEGETTLNLPNWAFESDDESADELGLIINGKAA